jgi:ParB-like chromosome segregation protein Spo0J
MEKTVNVIDVEISKLRQSKTNARVYSERRVDLLAESIDNFGQLENIVINKKNVVISGWLRVLAAG